MGSRFTDVGGGNRVQYVCIATQGWCHPGRIRGLDLGARGGVGTSPTPLAPVNRWPPDYWDIMMTSVFGRAPSGPSVKSYCTHERRNTFEEGKGRDRWWWGKVVVYRLNYMLQRIEVVKIFWNFHHHRRMEMRHVFPAQPVKRCLGNYMLWLGKLLHPLLPSSLCASLPCHVRIFVQAFEGGRWFLLEGLEGM